MRGCRLTGGLAATLRLGAAAALLATGGGCMVRRGDLKTGGVARTDDPLVVAGLSPAIDAELRAVAARLPRAAVADGEVARVEGPAQQPRSRPVASTPAPNSSSGPSTRPAGAVGIANPPTELAGATPPAIPEVAPSYPIDLPTALRLADEQNPNLAEARVAILSALADQVAANALLLPTLNAGTNYHGHTGDLQRASGRILSLSEQSLYVGGGARTLAAESVGVPAINIFSPLTEAIFLPLVARQGVAGARLRASASANAILGEVADLFLELIGAQTTLIAQRNSAIQADELARIVRDYDETGVGRKADADRAETERRLYQGRLQEAEEAVAVASARLSERLNLDPSIRLQSLSGPLEPLVLVDPEAGLDDLIRAAVARRPDLAAQSTVVGQAESRLKEELARPLLPTVSVGFSGGGFGGGSNLVPPLLGRFGGRTDFDVRAYWTLLNGGLGNLALQRQRKAVVNQAIADRVRVLNRVRAEVTSARAVALAEAQKVGSARAELVSAEDGFKDDFARLRETIGIPLESVNSLNLLARARVNLIEAITRANRAQFALFVALGTPPPPVGVGPSPIARPPVATPLDSPIRSIEEPMPPIVPPGPPIVGR